MKKFGRTRQDKVNVSFGQQKAREDGHVRKKKKKKAI